MGLGQTEDFFFHLNHKDIFFLTLILLNPFELETTLVISLFYQRGCKQM